MFTGIIESIGEVTAIKKEDANVHFTIKSPITGELKIDQSLAHEGVCLTVTQIDIPFYRVTAVRETLDKSTLGFWKLNKMVNLERAMTANARLDGHFVQGHVDGTLECISLQEERGSSRYTFSLTEKDRTLIVPKGSICINGVSLTVASLEENSFSVVIIPFTLEHTSLQFVKVGDRVNAEFDILGKYIQRHMMFAQGK